MSKHGVQVENVEGLKGVDSKGRMAAAAHGQAITAQAAGYSLDTRWHHAGELLVAPAWVS